MSSSDRVARGTYLFVFGYPFPRDGEGSLAVEIRAASSTEAESWGRRLAADYFVRSLGLEGRTADEFAQFIVTDEAEARELRARGSVLVVEVGELPDAWPTA